ncbi:MAG: hypothetical protein ACK5KQ_00740 [Anaerorhabdus sp.]
MILITKEGEEINYLFEINLKDFTVLNKTDVTDKLTELDIRLNTFFEFNDEVYFIIMDNRVMKIDLNSDDLFVSTSIQLPKELQSRMVVDTTEKAVYILDRGNPQHIVEIDLNKNVIVNTVVLEEVTSKTNERKMYSFKIKEDK